MPEPSPLLVVEDLKTYFFTRRGITKAVDGVSLTLHAGAHGTYTARVEER